MLFLCYSCFHDMMVQLYGQTKQYNPGKQSHEYIEHFQKIGSKPITCDTCSRTVTYEKEGDKWNETELA